MAVSEAASPAISFGKVASAAVEAAASAAAVDPSQHPAKLGENSSSVEIVVADLFTTGENSATQELGKGGNGKGDSLVGRPQNVFVARQDDSAVGDQEQQAGVPGDCSAVAAAAPAFPVATAAGSTGHPSPLDVVEDAGYEGEDGDGYNIAPPQLVERDQKTFSGASAETDAQRHQEEEHRVSRQKTSGVDDAASRGGRLGGAKPRSPEDDYEQGARAAADGPGPDEAGSNTMTPRSANSGEDGGDIQEQFGNENGLGAQQGVANSDCGSGLAAGSAGVRRSNDEDEDEDEDDEDDEDDDDENKEGEERQEEEVEEEKPEKTEEENRCDLEAAVDSLQFLLVRCFFLTRQTLRK